MGIRWVLALLGGPAQIALYFGGFFFNLQSDSEGFAQWGDSSDLQMAVSIALFARSTRESGFGNKPAFCASRLALARARARSAFLASRDDMLHKRLSRDSRAIPVVPQRIKSFRLTNGRSFSVTLLLTERQMDIFFHRCPAALGLTRFASDFQVVFGITSDPGSNFTAGKRNADGSRQRIV